MANEQRGDLVLPPNTFAFILDSTKGRVNVYVGPLKNSLSDTDRLVMWNSDQRKYLPVPDVEKATQVFPMAAEGQYIVLSNPAAGDKRDSRPQRGTSSESVDLDIGRKVNVPGPATFPLWPGQTARTIEGHHLRHNQYLIVRVYDEVQARKNWQSAVVKRQVTEAASQPEGTLVHGDLGDSTAPKPVVSAIADAAPELTMGQLMLVKGTEVSFYIPPTGIEVVPEKSDLFVREAVTLERLEYCILLDENGEKRYTQGPAVVFPKPTEKFVESEDRSRKFRAIELNEHSGLYVKVIAEYEEDGEKYGVGQELFITGKEQAIYFPRPEHSIIEYGDKKVHYAIAIPAGEGRYVLDRDKGTVDLVRGPKMFLPDPRTQVVVLRILDPHTVELFYPGNKEALAVNARYQQMSTGLQPGEHLQSTESARASGIATARLVASRDASDEYAGDAFRRGTTYTPPRSIVLNTKYEGAVAVDIWPGYAVLVTKKTGERRIEVGPKMVLLEYDETLMPLELSTSTPKSDSKLLRTAYLRVTNNQVSDMVTAETKDLVKVNVVISYRVNFEGKTEEEKQKWFGLENYVKVLTDHGRSRVRNAAKKYGIQEFYTRTIDIVRDAILGEVPAEGKRPGLAFSENGMKAYDVEVLNVSIEDNRVAGLLVGAQEKALTGAIQLSAAQEDAVRTQKLEDLKRSGLDETEKTATKLEEIKRARLDEAEKTAIKAADIAKTAITRDLNRRVAEAQANFTVAQETQKTTDVALKAAREAEEQEIELARKSATQELERMAAETEEHVKRMEAVSSEMVVALQMFGDKLFVEKLVEAVGPVALATGVSTVDIFNQIFKGTPLEGIMKTLADRPFKNKQ